MFKCKFWIGFLLVVYVLTILFQCNGYADIADALKSIILPVIAFIYFINVKKRTLFFSLFLILYSLSDLMVFIEPFISYYVSYYFGNLLYILGYLFLFLEISKSISFLAVIKNYKIHLMVLVFLNVYIGYVLQAVVNPYVEKTNEYYIEIVYNVVMLALLSVSLLNYFYRDNVKALYLFFGSICIVFAEVIWVAYTYISERSLLSVLSTSLYLAAYYFYYKQSKLENENTHESDMLLS